MIKKDEHGISRREFIRQSACAALELTSVVNTMAFLRLTNAAVTSSNIFADDYKALVCVFLAGGNDSNNLIVPMGDSGSNPIRADYEAGRVHLGLSDADGLHPLNVPANTNAFKKYYSSGTSPLGIHPSTPELAQMFNGGDLAFVCNVGSLLYPIPTRDDYINKLVPAPPRLFAHDAQQMQWQTSIADQPGAVGWGGRMADLMNAGYNGSESKVSMSISLAGINTFQKGMQPETAAFALTSGGARSLSGFGSNYSNAYESGSTFANPTYKDNTSGSRLKMVETLMQLTNDNLLENEYAQTLVSARNVEDAVGGSISAADGSGVDFDTIFADATTSLGDQLKMVAKLITGRSALGNRRQIFFVQVGGYDTHANQLESHSELMGELSTSLKAFKDALVAAGDWDKTVAFTASDFARTFSPNATGTDHAWAGHQIVMGGPVAGGDIYGHFPSLKTGDQPGSIDAHKLRGRWIPSIAVDQYASVMARWFGVQASEMDTIFPNLVRFNDPISSSEPNLMFLPVS
ncbi:MAG: DUF1501 domain-containing protein [Anaerolineae bacterium]